MATAIKKSAVLLVTNNICAHLQVIQYEIIARFSSAHLIRYLLNLLTIDRFSKLLTWNVVELPRS